MNPVLSLARPELLTLKPYAHAEWSPSLTRLHANEAPWRPPGDLTAAGLNRYPEPQPAALIERLAALYEVPRNSLLATRGSDEAIDVLSRMYLRAGEDAILQCTPTFGMYQVAARIQGADVIEVPLRPENGWRLDAAQLLAAWRPHVKLIYLCSPNNPTANLLDAQAVESVCAALDGKAIVVAILRTLSKAYALAGARLGALIAHPELIEIAKRIIPPYCLAQPTIEAALRALDAAEVAAARQRIAGLLAEREYLRAGLEASGRVERVWPSDTNFLLIDCVDADEFTRASRSGGLIVRDLRSDPALRRSLRVTVGTRAQNDALLNSLESA